MKKYKNILLLLILIGLLTYIGYFIINKPENKSKNEFDINDIDTTNLETIYLALGEEKIFESYDNVSVLDDTIVSINNNTIKSLSTGETTLVLTNKKTINAYKVIVTDLITLPTLNNNKEYLSCNRYSEDEASLLDDILAYRISEVGINTRAGAVAAARFLTLEFPYRLAYFYENGRLLTNGERTLADGEGRYYHVGLYLHENKFKTISVSNRGPAIWGCPLYSGVVSKITSNGLDCSGFIAWVMLNAGFDVGDGGAGISEEKTNDLDDLGPKLNINAENLNSDKIKVGDLFSRYGHIGILIGMEDDKYYVAEALDDDLHIKTYTKSSLLNSDWKYIILLDDLYGSDGSLKNMW